jgi:hypothetical protein
MDVGVKQVCPSKQALSELWLGMIGAFGRSWTSTRGELPVDDDGELTLTGGIWQRGLIGIDDAMVRRGFEACLTRADEWPPSLPAFRSMALGVPSLAQVKADLRANAVNNDRAPFTRMVWQYLDSYRFARADSETADRLLRDAYELAHQYVMMGGPLPEGSLAIAPPPAEPRTEAKPETVEACMAEIQRHLNTLPPAGEDAA